MTDSIFIDTDCISAFLWVNGQSLVEQLYGGRIIVPRQVYDEIDRPCVAHLRERLDLMISRASVEILSMDILSEEYEMFRSLTVYSEQNKRVIGRGEAACISLAKKYNATIASNNLRDIMPYVRRYNLKHISTGDIICEAYDKGYISEDDANELWQRMLEKRRMLGASSFTEYLKQRND